GVENRVRPGCARIGEKQPARRDLIFALSVAEIGGIQQPRIEADGAAFGDRVGSAACVGVGWITDGIDEPFGYQTLQFPIEVTSADFAAGAYPIPFGERVAVAGGAGPAPTP